MKKWIPNMYAVYESELLEKHLENLAAKGWILEKVGQSGFWLKKSEPRNLHYCVDIPSVQRKRGGSNDYLQPYYEMCEEAGWTFVGTNMHIHIFATEDPIVAPIHTDPSVRFEAAESYLKGQSAGAILVLVLMAAIVLPSLPRVIQMGDARMIFVGIVLILGVVITGESLHSYFRWRRIHEQAMTTGDWNVPKENRSIQFRALISVLYTIALLVAYWIMTKDQPKMDIKTVQDFLMMLTEPPFSLILLLIVFHFGRKFFWKRGYDETSGRAITGVLAFFAMIFLMMVSGIMEDCAAHRENGGSTSVKLEKIKEAPFTAEMLGMHSSYDAMITPGREDNYVSLEYIQILDGGGSLQYTYRLYAEEAKAEEDWASLHKRNVYATENENVNYSKEWVESDLSALGTENATVLYYQGMNAEFVSSWYEYNIQKGKVRLSIEYSQGLLTEAQLQVIADSLP